MTFYVFLTTTVVINVLLAAAMNLVLGQAGVLSIAHAAFMAIGAYATAILIRETGMSFVAAMVLAGLGTLAAAAAVGYLTLTLRGEAYILMSLGVQVIVIEILLHWNELTGGEAGIPGVPRPSSLGTPMRYLGFCAVVVALCLLVLHRLSVSRFGLVVRAVRDDEAACASAGWSVAHVRVAAFAVGSGLAGVAGALFAGQLRFVNASSFTVHLSLAVIVLVIVGGMGSVRGAVVGAVALTLVPELLDRVDLDQNVADAVRQITYGLLLVAFIRWRPQGLLPDRALVRARPAGASGRAR